MNWILGLVLVLIVVYLVDIQIKKRKTKSTRKTLKEKWGKAKTESYFNFELINKFFENHGSSEKVHQKISDNTWNDLDLNEVFKFIDRTTSKIGQQYLYFKLRTIKPISELKQFGELTELFSSNKRLRIQTQLELSKIASDKGYLLEEIFRSTESEKPGSIWLFYFLSTGALMSIILGFFDPTWFLALVPIFFINLVLHYKNKYSVQYYLNGVSQLASSYVVAKNLSTSKEIKSFSQDLDF